MNSYMDFIIRIYRFDPDKPRSLVGVVEEVGKKGKKAFNGYDELWEILNSPKEGDFSPKPILSDGAA